MKISIRILLINFIIVVLVFVSSTIAFYSVTRNIISSQQSRNLQTSAKDFIFSLQSVLQETDDDFLKIVKNNKLNESANLQDSKVDFIISANKDSSVNPSLFLIKPSLYSESKFNTLSKFVEIYPNVIIKKYERKDSQIFYYGRIINSELLDNIAKRIRADISVLHDDVTIFTSNPTVNQQYLYEINSLSKELALKNTYDIGKVELSKSDLYATQYSPKELPGINPQLKFLIFSTLPEAAELRENINNLLVIIGFTGVTLSLILALIFTEKIRKQITHLSEAADITRSGNLKHRVSMLTKDELGRLGLAFNSMLDEIEKNQNAKNEYTDFITLINQNPTLDEISESALIKIINATGFTAGRFFLVEDREIKPVSSYGIKNDLTIPGSKIDLYQRVIEKQETVEFSFKENFPKIHTGIVSIDVRYLLLYPVIYNKKVIAVLELAAIGELKEGAKEYLENIHHQLAIGLSNANAFHQMKDLVQVLKKLNDEYQKQNEQIKDQNKTLIELHGELKEKTEELELQREKALDAAMHKSQFLASMSHELKTPLNSVLGLTELIMNDRSIGHQNREKLEIVLRNGNRLMILINDILNFSKLEAGKMEVQNECFSIDELIQDINLQILPILKNKDIEFRIENKAEAKKKIVADKFKINQILINLLSNAVKFTEKGNIKLIIENAEESKLKFTVKDTGIGIAGKDRDLIFEEFRQVDGSSKRKYNGTGLGLAISKRYAELLQGTLDYESEIGKGSAFYLIVPVQTAVESDEAVQVQMLSDETNNKDESKTVLIIDDNAAHHLLIRDYLASKNFSVAEAFSRQEGIDKAFEIKPFVIVLNVFLQNGQDGWHVLKALKENESTREIPVILITILDELHTGYGLQVYDYILKPMDEDSFNKLAGRFQISSKRKLENIAYIGSDESDIKVMKQTLGDSCEMHYIKDPAASLKALSRIQPDLAVMDISQLKSDGISLLKKLKDSVETKDIPIVLCLSNELIEREMHLLNNIIENETIKSKGHPIDVLKVIKDRIHLEEGLPVEDTSTMWLEPRPEDYYPESSEIVQKENSQNGNNQNGNKFSKNKVLIVDDDNDTLFTVGEIVRQTGCETVLARNGVECLSVLQQYTPDLILLDIMMPQMDGFETIKRIRSDSSLSDIPVFALTALAMIEEKAILIKNGFDDFIPKPVNPGMLISKVENQLINI